MSHKKQSISRVAALHCITAILLLPNSPVAMAQESDVTDWNIQIGVGVEQASDIWTGTKNKVTALPDFSISKGNWHSNTGNLVGYRVQFTELWSASVGIGARNDGYDDDYIQRTLGEAARVFDGYVEPDTEAVVNYGVSYGWMSLDVSTDVSNKSDSNSASLAVEITIYQLDNGLSISTTASVDWYDSNYVNHYYGVAGEQVDDVVGRVAYRSSAAINYGIGVNAVYPIGESWSVMGVVSRTKLDDNIVNSPLVDTDHQNLAALMVVYQF
jgi:outer membrane scaffolding protein for murein synthesis (MipA/OmpV family)